METKDVKKITQKAIHFSGIGEIKALKDGGVVIEGLANKNVVDRGKDIIATDAWDLENYKKNPVILFNHGFDAQLGSTPVGKAIEIKPTENGLYIKAQLASIDDPLINRIRGLVEERILRAFSVGFNPIESDMEKASGIRTITKAELFEVSIVGVPMNQDSLFEISGKMLKGAKTMDDLRLDILTRKGCLLAAQIHMRIHEMQKDPAVSKDTILADIAAKAGLEDAGILADVLAGNLTPAPEAILGAFSEVLSLDLDSLKAMDAEDKKLYDAHEALETPDEEATEEPGEPEEAGEEDPEALGKEEAPSKVGSGKKDPSKDDEESNKANAKGDPFATAVEGSITKLISEGKEPQEAIAESVSLSSKDLPKKSRPTKVQYTKWFELADRLRGTYLEKQADQGEDVISVTSTINAAKSESDNNEFGSPQMDMMKQTNVLLGALINEVQKMSAKLDGLSSTEEMVAPKPKEGAPVVVEGGKEDEEKAKAKPEAGKDEEAKSQKGLSKKFHIEILKGAPVKLPKDIAIDFLTYGDPVNLKYRCGTAEECLSSRKAFKGEASAYSLDESKASVHKRIIEATLAFGTELDYDEEDSLDVLLPEEIKASLIEISRKMLDSYAKRLENVKMKLKEVETRVRL